MKVFLLLVTITCVFTLPWHSDYMPNKLEEDDIAEKVIRSHYQKAPKYVGENLHFGDSNATLLGFSWSNCASGSDLTINKLNIAPDPIVIPGTVTVGLDATIATEVTAITSADLVVKKKILGFFVEIPCVDNVGSCTYNDICSLLSNITCPQQLIDMGFTCQCPFKAKDYEVPDGTSLKLPTIPIPTSLEDGDYEIKVTLKNGSTVLGCYDFKASLKAAGRYALVTKK